MDIGKSFTFVFEDDEWVVKALIVVGIVAGGVLLSWLVIPALFAALLLGGYGVEITRRVIHGKAPTLPAWDDWGKLFTDGLMVWIIGLVYALPLIVFGLCVGTPLSAVGDDPTLSSLLGSCLGFLNLLWAIVMSFLLPPAIALYAKEGDLGAAFRFGEVVALVRDHFSTYLVTVLVAWVVSFIGGLGIVVCGLGWLFTMPYAALVTSHLYGQAFLEASSMVPQGTVEDELA